jgi:hypothetical protein
LRFGSEGLQFGQEGTGAVASVEMRNTAYFGRPHPGYGSRAAFCAAFLLFCPAVTGCSGSDRLKKQVSGLESQVTAMRADQDRLEERLAAIELGASVPRSPGHASGSERERLEHPRLKVIHLAPDEPTSSVEPVDEPAVAPASSAHRPIIRGTGDRVIKMGDGDSADESTKRDDSAGTKPVAQLNRDAHGN